MGFEFVSELPTPDQIREAFPLEPDLALEKEKKDAQIRDVFTGKSDKFLVIIGPCSADREDSVCDYVCRLAGVQEKVKDKLILIRASTPISRGPQGTAIRGFCTSRIRRRSRICTRGLLRSASFTCG